MNNDELLINERYVKDIASGKKTYTLVSGAVKEFRLTPLTRKLIKKDSLWYRLKDFDQETQERLEDMAITLEDLQMQLNRSKVTKDRVLDAYNVSVYVDESTMLLPVVGNILPSDSTCAYTVKFVNGMPTLQTILVCWGCHWSELFTGQTKYGNNVFCLASDLTPEVRAQYLDEMIPLGQVQEFLGMGKPDKGHSL